ncbi:hypothetical protein U5907_02470 [Bacteroidales bacterium MB20-C3-3]|nr:hypothetical protein U5907_02470 [Bacteroidales bacterium MB20-C3-3]
MKLPKIPSIANVKQALGVFSTDSAEVLCSHFKVNKWSRIKPVRHEKIGEMTEGDYKNVDFGFDLRLNESLASTVLSDLFGDKDWPYLQPRSGIDVCRLHDFSYYNHDAEPPFSINCTGTNGTENNPNAYIYYTIDQNRVSANCEIYVEDLDLFNENCSWGILWRKLNDSQINYVGREIDDLNVIYPISQVADIEIIVPVTYSLETIELCAVIFKPNDRFYLVPNSYRTVEVKKASNQEVLLFRAWGSGHYTAGSKNVYIGLTLKDEKNQPRSYTYTVYVNVKNSSGGLITSMQNIGSGSVLANQQIDVPLGDGTNTDSGGTPIFRNEDIADTALIEYIIQVIVDNQAGQTISIQGECTVN